MSRIAWAATLALLFVEGALQVSGYSDPVLAVALLGGAVIAGAVGWYFWSEEKRLQVSAPRSTWTKLPPTERRLLGLLRNGHGVLASIPPRGRDGVAWGVPLATFHAMLDRLIALDVLSINDRGDYELSPLGRQLVQIAPGHDGPITEDSGPVSQWTALVDVARLAYEATRNTTMATAAERDGSPDNTLSYYCILISHHEPIFGTPLPSRVMEQIDLGSYQVTVRDGVASIRDPYGREPRWENISVKTDRVQAIIAKIKEVAGT